MIIERTQDSARAFRRLYTQAGIELDQLLKQIRQEMAVQHHFADETCEGPFRQHVMVTMQRAVLGL